MKFISYVLLTTCVVSQLSGRYTGLVDHSPFLPSNHGSKTEKTAKPETKKPNNDYFALNGISKIGDNYLFSILDKRTKKSKWVQPERAVNGLVITSYDPEQQIIEFIWDDQTFELQLANVNEHSSIEFAFAQQTQDSSENHPKHNTSVRVNDKGTAYSLGSDLTLRTRVKDQNTNKTVIAKLTNYHRSLEKAITKVYFSNATTNYNSMNDPNVEEKNLDADNTPSDKLFASVELPEDIAIDTGIVQRYKIKRRNVVHNPTGKLPD